MNDVVLRALVVGLAAGIALGLAWLARRGWERRGYDLTVDDLAEGPAVVVFTSQTCPNCAATLERLSELDLPVRNITAEDEAALFDHAGVTGVPTTVFVDSAGRPVARFGGLPSRRFLARAARAALRRGGRSV